MNSVLERSERTLRRTLMEIRDWRASRQDAARVLTNVACLIGNRLQCNACSIYLIDEPNGRLLLSGTVGLRQDCVGTLHMELSEGLTGLVASERRPVVISAQASAHPNFKFFPEAGEEPYESFLGVPIIHDDIVKGVLVVQTVEPHEFTTTEVRLMTLAGQEVGVLLNGLDLEFQTDGAP